MQRRAYLTLSGGLFAGLAGCGTDDDGSNGNGGGDGGSGGGGDADGGGGGGNSEPTEEPTDEPTEEELSAAGEMAAVSNNPDWLQGSTSFSGSGQTVTDVFEAQRFTTFTFEHSGESNFIVELIDDDSGDSVDILVNKIGETSGAVGIGLADGNYVLDVDADGDWSIEAGEPMAPEGEYGVPPASISGEASDVYGEVEIDGRVTVTGSHDGSENFIVQAWEEANSSGFADELIFNEIGQFEGETSVNLEGLFYIQVEADGTYTVEFE